MILTDLRMARVSGMKVIEQAQKLPNNPAVIMITAYGDVETAVEAMKKGAFDFVTKPVNLEDLELLIKRALKQRKQQAESEALEVEIVSDTVAPQSGIVPVALPQNYFRGRRHITCLAPCDGTSGARRSQQNLGLALRGDGYG